MKKLPFPGSKFCYEILTLRSNFHYEIRTLRSNFCMKLDPGPKFTFIIFMKFGPQLGSKLHENWINIQNLQQLDTFIRVLSEVQARIWSYISQKIEYFISYDVVKRQTFHVLKERSQGRVRIKKWFAELGQSYFFIFFGLRWKN